MARSTSTDVAHASHPRPQSLFVTDALRKPRVVIAHDYLTQRGGAERVVLALMEAFPDAPIVTSVYNPDTTFAQFRHADIRTSWLSRVPAFRKDARRALPFLAATWSKTRITDADVVICSSTGWAHGVTTTARKIVYCHNPARWLYQPDEYLLGAGLLARVTVKTIGNSLRRWDQRAAESADVYLANSSTVAARVASTYGISAAIMHPPSAVEEGYTEPVRGVQPGYLLTVGRSRCYKNTPAVAAAVDSLPGERLIAVGGVPEGPWSSRIRGLTDLTDAQMRWLYANADALVACAYEDFGLTPIEAYTAGTPALVLESGGYLDTTVPGVTGEFIRSTRPEDIASAITMFRQRNYSSAKIQAHAASFSLAGFADRIRVVARDAHAPRASAA